MRSWRHARRHAQPRLCLALAAALAIGPSFEAWGQTPVVTRDREINAVDTTLLAAPEAGKFDLKYVTPAAVALLALHPRQLLTSPATEMMPVEVVAAAGLQELGFDPADVDELVAFAEPPLGVSLPYGVVLKFSKPFTLDQFPAKLLSHTQPAELEGRAYQQGRQPNFPSFYMPDDRTLLVMPDATLRRVLSPPATTEESSLRQRVAGVPAGDDVYAVVDIAALRPIIVPWLNVAAMRKGDDFPADAKPFLELPNLIAAVDLSFNITNKKPTLLAIHANDGPSADRLEELYSLAEQLQRKNTLANAAQLKQSDDPITNALGRYLERVGNTKQETYKVERRAENLILFKANLAEQSQKNKLLLVAAAGFLVALLLPAVQAAREAARRNQAMNSMKQLLLAMHVYADSKRVLPPHANYNAEGKPLLSWRVHLLPYLEQDELYRQFKLDEPWDSEHNRALIAQMPAVFASPHVKEPGKTNFLAVVGAECVFDGSGQGLGFRDVSDGLSRTIVLVEANPDRAVEWTRPSDFEFDTAEPAAGLGGVRPAIWLAGFADGHVQAIPNDTPDDVVRAMFTRSGHELVALP